MVSGSIIAVVVVIAFILGVWGYVCYTDNRERKQIAISFMGYSVGVAVQEPNGSISPLEAVLQQAFINRGARVFPLIRKNVAELMRSGITQEKYADVPLDLFVFCVLRVKEENLPGRLVHKYTLDFRAFHVDGYLFGAGEVSEEIGVILRHPAPYTRLAENVVGRIRVSQKSAGTITAGIGSASFQSEV